MSGHGPSRRSAIATGFAGVIAAPAILRAQTRQSVTIVNAAGGVTLTLETLMRKQGYFEEFGLDAAFVNVADTAKAIGALIGGDADICMLSGFGQVLAAIEKGAKMKIVAAAGALAPNAVFTAKSDIRTMQDLKGKVIGAGSVGSALHQIMVAALQKSGVDPTSVRFVNVGSTIDILKAVAAGTVDAGPCNVDVYGVADKLKVHALADLWRLIPEYPFQGSFATDAAIRAKRDILVRVLAAHAKLYRFISGSDSKAAYIAANVEATGAEPAQAEGFWNYVRENKPYAVDLAIPEARISFLQNLNVQTGVQRKVVPNADAANMSLAAEAVKRLG